MKALKWLGGLFLALALVSVSTAGEKTVLKFAHNYPLGHPHYEGAELFKKLVEQRPTFRWPASFSADLFRAS